jgi:hypothetical protein
MQKISRDTPIGYPMDGICCEGGIFVEVPLLKYHRPPVREACGGT